MKGGFHCPLLSFPLPHKWFFQTKQENPLFCSPPNSVPTQNNHTPLEVLPMLRAYAHPKCCCVDFSRMWVIHCWRALTMGLHFWFQPSRCFYWDVTYTHLATDPWGSAMPLCSQDVAHLRSWGNPGANLEAALCHDFGRARILSVLIPTAVNGFMGLTNTVVDNMPHNSLNIAWLFPRLLKGKKQIWQLIKSDTAQLLR